jgi:tetratricopeptide (TPR) repeat protein
MMQKFVRLREVWSVQELRITIALSVAFALTYLASFPTDIRVMLAIVFSVGLIGIWTTKIISALAAHGFYSSALFLSKYLPVAFKTGPALTASVLLLAGRWSEVKQLACASVFDNTGTPTPEGPTYYEYAKACLDLGETTEARRLFEIAIEKYPDHFPYQYGLAEFLIIEGETPERAHLLLDQVMVSACQFYSGRNARLMRAECLALIGWTYALRAMPQEARNSIRSAHSEASFLPKSGRASVFLIEGACEMRLGALDNARRAFESSLALFPHGANALFNKRRLADLELLAESSVAVKPSPPGPLQ